MIAALFDLVLALVLSLWHVVRFLLSRYLLEVVAITLIVAIVVRACAGVVAP